MIIQKKDGKTKAVEWSVLILFFPLSRYEDLRYWYDCLCYEEELRQYHDYISVIGEIEDHRHLEVFVSPVYPQTDHLYTFQFDADSACPILLNKSERLIFSVFLAEDGSSFGMKELYAAICFYKNKIRCHYSYFTYQLLLYLSYEIWIHPSSKTLIEESQNCFWRYFCNKYLLLISL